MSTPAVDVVTPVEDDADKLAKVLSFLEVHKARHDSLPTASFFFSPERRSTTGLSCRSRYTASSSRSCRR